MSAPMGSDGEGLDQLADFRSIIEDALSVYEARQEQDEPQEDRPSICWDCLRATWECLCQWPAKRWSGMRTRPGPLEDGRRLLVVVECPAYWPG
ncbi:MAG: hypothetical protein K6U74_04885 [Firmicutes bacterium]|nr:hypothetical protein [Bacillota bacterium]